jgi:mono/diheme cytochrome c family protein
VLRLDGNIDGDQSPFARRPDDGQGEDIRMVKSALALVLLLCALASARGAEVERGRVLYEARCGRCHGTSVHVREARKAASFEGVRTQVVRWNAELGVGWSDDEINDVTLYLNNRYYFFPCPESICRSGQATSETGRNLAHSRVERQ